MPQSFRHWNLFRALRILLSRIQEALWRRSWPALEQPAQGIPHPEHFKSIRTRMVADICIATAYAFGNDAAAEPAQGAVSSGLLLLSPLGLAGTCLLEQLAEVSVSPGGSRIMMVDESIHNNPTNLLEQNSPQSQLCWLIERIDYVAHKVGIGSAACFSRFFRGQGSMFFDIARSTVLKDEALDTFLESEMLDLSELANLEFSPGLDS